MDSIMYELPDGSGFFTASMSLPKDHWLYDTTAIPVVLEFRHTSGELRKDLRQSIRLAAEQAIREATAFGQIKDFDPDAMAQRFVLALMGVADDEAAKEI